MKILRLIGTTVWGNRTSPERVLLLLCLGLAGLTVLLLVMLRNGSPLATEWGNVAEWAGAWVTFLGFIGAIAALRVQVKSVNLQLAQHNKQEAAEKAIQATKLAAQAESRVQQREKDARAVELSVTAGRQDAGAGHHQVHRQPFRVSCLLAFPTSIARYTDIRFIVPEVPDGFRVTIDDRALIQNGTVRWGKRIWWQASGHIWPYGNESEALTWAAAHTSVSFKDPSGVSWTLSGTGDLKEAIDPAE